MKKILVALAVALVLPAAAWANSFSYIALMNGANENPAVPTAGTGTAIVTYDNVAHTLSYNVSFTGLTGLTTAAHIHCCAAPPTNVGVATTTPSFPGFPLNVTAGVFNNTFNLTLAGSWNPAFVTAQGSIANAEAAMAAALAAGQAYFNIHTTFRTGGEIRGYFAVPEPSAAWLVGPALGLLALRRRSAR